MFPLSTLSLLTPMHVSLSLQTSVENWTKTKWRQINVDQMDAELRKFAKVRPPIVLHHTGASLLLFCSHAPLLFESDASND